MAIHINPVELLKWMQSRKREELRAIAEYIEQMATAAAESAHLWSMALIAISDRADEARRQIDAPDSSVGQYRRGIGLRQVCVRLDCYYYEHSRVVSQRLSRELLDELTMRLGAYLRTRNIARDLHAQVSRELTYALQPNADMLCQVRNIVDALNHDAAVLRALSDRIRAT